MKNICNPSDFAALHHRIFVLQKDNRRGWGRMNINQMLGHCTQQLRLALGLIPSNPQAPAFYKTWLGRRIAFSPFPWPKGYRTPHEMDPALFNFERYDFDTNKLELLKYLDRVQTTNQLHPHPFFGELSKREWGRLIYKHLDHHLRQFSEGAD